MSRLLLGLPIPGASPAEWPFAVQAETGRLTHHGSAALAALPKLGHVTVLVPAAALSWHRIQVPKAVPARMRAALEGVLEDQLLDEPASLHFALAADAKPGQDAWVAVCDKAWLRSQLMRLVEVGLPITRVVPAVAPLPADQAPQLHIGGDAHQPQAVWADVQGVQHGPLQMLLSAGLEVKTAQVSSEPQVLERAEQMLQRSVQLQPAHERWLAAATTDWNLAQFDLRGLGQSGPLARLRDGLRALMFDTQWRPLRWALGLG